MHFMITGRRAVGARGLEVGPVCLGITGSEDVVPAAFDAGVNFFFVTADMHWPLYEETRRGLAKLLRRPGVRDRIVVAAVSYVTQSEFCWAPFEEVVEAVPGLERIDVSVMGGAYASDFATRVAEYREHVVQGFAGVKAIGGSFHDRKAALGAANGSAVDIAFVRFNAGHMKPAEDFFPKLAPERRTLVYGFKTMSGYAGRAPNADGWAPEPSDHYRFVLSHPGVDGVLCALDSPGEVDALVKSLEKGPLDVSQQRHLIELARARNPRPR